MFRLPINDVVLGVKAMDQDGADSLVSAYVNPPRTPTEYIVQASFRLLLRRLNLR
jgi:hypothetical protein